VQAVVAGRVQGRVFPVDEVLTHSSASSAIVASSSGVWAPSKGKVTEPLASDVERMVWPLTTLLVHLGVTGAFRAPTGVSRRSLQFERPD
jgi:hypothetical protein